MFKIIKILIVLASVSAIIYSIIFYYPQFFIEILPAWLIGLVFALSCLLLGYRFRQTIKILEISPFKISFSFFMGSTVILFILIASLFFKIFYSYLIIAISIACIILNIKYLKDIIDDLAFLKNNNAFTAIILIQFLIMLFAASTPPYFYDSLVYHLAMPGKYLQYHSFFYYEDVFFTAFPLNASLFYAIPLSFGDDMAAQIVSVIFILFTCIAIREFCLIYFSEKTANLSATIFLTVPIASLSAIIPAAESALVFFTTISFLSLFYYFSNNHKLLLIISGISCGIALGIKYTHAAYFLIVFFSILIFLPKNFSIRKRANIATLVIVFTAIAFSPWLIKNLIYHSDPFYPYFSKLSGKDAEILEQLVPRSGLINAVKKYTFIIFRMHFKPLGAAGILSPLFICIFPWIIYRPKQNQLMHRLLRISSIFGIITFALTVHWLRIFIEVVPLLSILYAIPLSDNNNNIFKRFGIYLAKIIIIFNIFILVIYSINFKLIEYSIGSVNKDQFLSSLVDYYPFAKMMEKNIPPQATVLLIGESRTYYFRQNCIPHFPPERAIHLEKMLNQSKNLSDFLEKLRQKNVSYVLINYNRIFQKTNDYNIIKFLNLTPNSANIMQRFTASHLLPIHKDNYYMLYKIK